MKLNSLGVAYGVYDSLKSSFQNSAFKREGTENLVVKGLKITAEAGEKTVLLVAFLVAGVAFPIIIGLEALGRGFLHVGEITFRGSKGNKNEERIGNLSKGSGVISGDNVSSKAKKSAPTETMMTYQSWGGRFGDCLMNYLHAKWLSFKYDLPLAYKPFEYSDSLVLSEEEAAVDMTGFKKQFEHNDETTFARVSGLSKEERERDKQLHISMYFSESRTERGPLYKGPQFVVDWNNPDFKKLIQGLVKAKNSLRLVQPPKDRTSIAIHWRAGSGPDDLNTRNYFPCKLPGEEYYLSQVVRACQILENQPLYLHLFTDAKNPKILQKKILDRLKAEGIKQDIVFGEHSGEDSVNIVLEDFFSMAEFDCLIRSESHYSMAAQCIGNHKLVLAPRKYRLEVSGTTAEKAEFIFDEITIFEGGQAKDEASDIRFPCVYSSKEKLNDFLRHHEEVFGWPQKR